jgi:threonine dehydrogenase-like Zn-dependent dehydrogenase
MKALLLTAEWQPKTDYALSERERSSRRAFVSSQVYRNPRLELTSLPTPTPGPGQVLIRVKACGVCGSDLHLYEKAPDGYVAYGDHTRLPVVLGHEWSGVVEETGPGVGAVARGDKVCVEPNNWCGVCAPCRAGRFNQCSNLEEIGFTVNGGFAEYVAVEARYCWKTDSLAEAYGDDLADDVGAMVEPVAVGYNALFVRSGGFRPGGNVVVFGAGPIGLACVALARAAGAATILALDTVPERLDLARKLGADRGVNPTALASEGPDPAEAILAETRGAGVDLGVEAAGASPHTFPILERVLAPGGKIVQVGIGRGTTPVSLVRLQQLGIDLHGAIGNSGQGIFPSVIRLLAAKRLDVAPMITAHFPLADALAAFARTAERRDGKVLVKP